MPENFRENELRVYWLACQEARRGDDPAAGYDSLYAIAMHSDWPLLLFRAATALSAPSIAAMQ